MTISKSEKQYQKIAELFVSSETDVEHGRMMSSPAITCNGKVFAFYYNKMDSICCKLGKEYDITGLGVKKYELLNPFKNKPPMAGWYVVPMEYKTKWEKLAKEALKIMRNG